MEFRLLGAPEVWLDGQQLELTAGKPMALLAAGLLRANRVVSTSGLVDAIWGDAPPSTAADVVQKYVSNLRRVLHVGGRQVILTRPPGYLFKVEHDEVDVSRFESLAAAGRAAAAAGEDRDAVLTLRAALAIWRGPALDGLHTPVLRQVADGLEELRLSLTEERIGAELRLGRFGPLAAELATLVAAYPLRETLRAQQMLALYRLGRQADALDAYQQARELLRAELGIDPGTELRRTYQAILTADPALHASTGGSIVVTAPEPAPAGDPPAEPGPLADLIPRQLPPRVVELIGRDRQTARLREMLQRATSAEQPICCVVTGKAGSGKTALAVAAAHAVSDVFDGGQLYAAFRGAGTEETAEILSAFLRVLGQPASRLPGTVAELSGLFRSRIAGRRILIVLDNVGSEAQIRPLLPAQGGGAVLLTTRTALVGLDPQGTLGLDVLEPGDALRLLAWLVGADRVAEEPAAADEIVRLCGGLPLAVRTAGARLAVRQRWPLSVLAARLRDEHRRLDELVAGDLEVRASLHLSYSSLPDPVRLAFRRLGVSGAGEFSPWLLEPLLDAPESEAEYFAERLADAQLVDATGVGLDGQVRYAVHDLIRLFAQERADEEEPIADQRHTVERLGRRLLAVIADRAARVPGAAGAPQADAQAWLDQERWLLTQAVERVSRLGMHRLACDLCTAVRVSFRLRNAFEAWWRTHHAALGAAQAAGDRFSEAILLRGLGQLRYEQDRLADAAEYYARAREVFREQGDLRGQADCLIGLASTHREEGRFPEALRLLAEASRAYARLEDAAGLAECAYGIGYVNREVGSFAHAQEALRRALAAYRRIGDRRGEGLTLRSMAMVHRARGELDAAELLSTQAIAAFREIGDELLAAYGLQCLAKVQIRQGRSGLAEAPLRAALQVCDALGDRFGAALVTRTIGELHLATGDLDAAAARLGEAREHWVAMGLDLFQARTDRDLAEVHWRRGDQATARDVHALALATFQRYGSREAHELAQPPS